MSVCLLYFITRDLKVIRRGVEKHLNFYGVGVMSSQSLTELREEPQLLSCHSHWALGLKTVTILTSQRS